MLLSEEQRIRRLARRLTRTGVAYDEALRQAAAQLRRCRNITTTAALKSRTTILQEVR